MEDAPRPALLAFKDLRGARNGSEHQVGLARQVVPCLHGTTAKECGQRFFEGSQFRFFRRLCCRSRFLLCFIVRITSLLRRTRPVNPSPSASRRDRRGLRDSTYDQFHDG